MHHLTALRLSVVPVLYEALGTLGRTRSAKTLHIGFAVA